EARDRPGVAFTIERAGDAEAVVRVARGIGEKRLVGNVLDQTGAEGRGGDAEDDVVGVLRLLEARLPLTSREGAAGGVGAAFDGVEILHASVRTGGVGVAKLVEEEREGRLA